MSFTKTRRGTHARTTTPDRGTDSMTIEMRGSAIPQLLRDGYAAATRRVADAKHQKETAEKGRLDAETKIAQLDDAERQLKAQLDEVRAHREREQGRARGHAAEYTRAEQERQTALADQDDALRAMNTLQIKLAAEPDNPATPADPGTPVYQAVQSDIHGRGPANGVPSPPVAAP